MKKILLLLGVCLLAACGVYDEEMKKDDISEKSLPKDDEEARVMYTVETGNDLRDIKSSMENLDDIFTNDIEDNNELDKITDNAMTIVTSSNDQSYYLGSDDFQNFEGTSSLIKEINILADSMFGESTKDKSAEIDKIKNDFEKLLALVEQTIKQFEVDKNK